MSRTPDPAAAAPDVLTLEEIDRDGAFLEAVAGVYGVSRAELIRKAAFGGAVLLGAFTVPTDALAAGRKGDTHILNFDLVFEYLQSSFYLGAVRAGTVAGMRPEKARWARVLGAHELAHVRILRKVLGREAVKKPFFNFHGVTENEAAFTKTAVAMEDLTVALLAGQAPRFEDPGLVAAVFSLLSVEARHAAWARRLSSFRPVASAFDEPRSLSDVGRVVASTRFIAARPRTRARKHPRFTG